MNLEITGRHINVTERLKNYAEKKISRIEKYFNQIISTQLIFFEEKDDRVVEIIINADGAKFYGSEHGETFFASIDILSDKVELQIKKHKEKLQRHKATGVAYLPVVDFDTEEEESLEVVEASSKPLGVKEAFLEFKLEKRDYLLYKKDNLDLDFANKNYALLYTKDGEHFHLEVPEEMFKQKKYNGCFNLRKVNVKKESATDPEIEFEDVDCQVLPFNLNQALSAFDESKTNFYPFFNIESESLNVLKKNGKGLEIAVPAEM